MFRIVSLSLQTWCKSLFRKQTRILAFYKTKSPPNHVSWFHWARRCLPTPNPSDTDPVRHRSYPILNLSDTEPVRCRTCPKPNLPDIEPVQYRTFWSPYPPDNEHVRHRIRVDHRVQKTIFHNDSVGEVRYVHRMVQVNPYCSAVLLGNRKKNILEDHFSLALSHFKNITPLETWNLTIDAFSKA